MLTFPTHLFNPASIQIKLAGVAISGGEALSGETDTIRTDGGGYWVVRMSGIELITPDQIRAWRAWEDMLDGGVEKVLVPVADVRQAPRPVVGGALSRPSQLENSSDDPYFPEAIAFATPWIVASVTGSAALRATQLVINVTRGARLRGGEVFAVDHAVSGRRLYRVRRVLSSTGQEATVSIRPPLREALTAPKSADFDWPALTATLVPDNDISPDIQNGRHASVNIAFREAF